MSENKMKNLINEIQNLNCKVTAQIGSIHVENSWQYPKKRQFNYGDVTFAGILFCCERHLQFLKNLGVKIDFSNKRIGLTAMQKYVGSGQNECAVSVIMDVDTFLKIEPFTRRLGVLDIVNDFHLSGLGFRNKLKNFEKNTTSENFNEPERVHFRKIAEFRSRARNLKQRKPQVGYGFC